VLVEEYTYCAGDDAVAVKSGWNWAGQHVNISSRNITVRNARSGCRGGFTIGSEMSGGVTDVLFEDCASTGESGIRISSELGFMPRATPVRAFCLSQPANTTPGLKVAAALAPPALAPSSTSQSLPSLTASADSGEPGAIVAGTGSVERGPASKLLFHSSSLKSSNIGCMARRTDYFSLPLALALMLRFA
jgi:hypothetical protein